MLAMVFKGGLHVATAQAPDETSELTQPRAMLEWPSGVLIVFRDGDIATEDGIYSAKEELMPPPGGDSSFFEGSICHRVLVAAGIEPRPLTSE